MLRQSRPFLAFILAVLAFSVARQVRAQDIAVDREAYRSPQMFALDLRVGPYYPNVDSEFGGDPALRPHRAYFGTSKRYMPQLGLEVQVFRKAGTFSIGGSIGYLKENASAFVEGGPTVATTDRSSDNTSLMMVPLSASFIYRFDIPARKWGIPLVPFGRAGLDWAYWSIADANGRIATSANPGGKGRGATTGWHAGVGLAILLDVFDPGAAQEFDANTGVNHTYLFGELTHTELDGFGRQGALRLGDTTWSLGLLLEF